MVAGRPSTEYRWLMCWALEDGGGAIRIDTTLTLISVIHNTQTPQYSEKTSHFRDGKNWEAIRAG
jgi:hypothetical protein